MVLLVDVGCLVDLLIAYDVVICRVGPCSILDLFQGCFEEAFVLSALTAFMLRTC